MNKKRTFMVLATAIALLSMASLAWGAAELTMEVHPEKFVKIGEDFYYTIRMHNVGDETAFNAEITPTYDSNITTAAAPVVVGNIDAGEVAFENILVTVDGSTADQTAMTSSFDLDYEDGGATPYPTVTETGTNRAFIFLLLTPQFHTVHSRMPSPYKAAS